MSESSELIIKLESLEKRVLFLEQKCRQMTRGDIENNTKTEDEYSGVKGGILKLLDNGNFKKPIGLTEVRELLAKLDYNYPRQSVNNALRRLSTSMGKLVVINGKIKQYATRK